MFFENVQTIEELKKEYRRLALLHHPDSGGNTQTMQNINNEYDSIFNIFKNNHNNRATTSDNTTNCKDRPIEETPEEFREIIYKIINLKEIVIELCGNWIWVSGDTLPHKDYLKATGLKWASKKKMWYWRPEEFSSFNRKTLTIEQIRSKYGSEVVKENYKKSITA